MISISDLTKVALRKGYVVFENDHKPYNINYWGIRNPDTGFNDEFHLFWKYKGNWSHLIQMGTTDPGIYYLENPLNAKGTAILKEGQWRGCWELGKHKGQYDALVQAKAVTVWRDNDKDANLEYTNPDTGFFGINHHRSHNEVEVKEIGKYSAGCQVRHNPYEYSIFIQLCKMAAVNWGDSFSYTLININDL